MIARVQGKLESVEGTVAIVATEGGIAYAVHVPAFLASELATVTGVSVTLHTLQLIEASAQGSNMTPRLIGFRTKDERRFFELFTTVKGLGTRRGLRAMAAPVGEIARAIAGRDVAWLQKLPEIGKRLAETVVAELHGKVDGFAAPGGAQVAEGKPTSALSGDVAQQAIAALVRLGEARQEAERKIERALANHPKAARATADELLAAAFALAGG
ncbi:MAG: hypothetical protein KDA20_05605 [Phycisphaerales bacterium]|nr:hypothetical protein [Phycisphaerales bacterium]